MEKVVTIYVDNGLDQSVVVQIKANRDKKYSKSINVGSPFSVSANNCDARTLTPETSGWLPYIMVEVKCDTAPTTGSLTIRCVRSMFDQAKLVDSLEIRDTSVHNPDTDPSRIFIVPW